MPRLARERRHLLGRPRHDLVGIGTAMTSRASPLKWPRKPPGVLGGEHADDQHERRGVALLEIGHARPRRPRAIRVVAAVEPEFATRAERCRSKLAARQPLQPSRPVGPRHALPRRRALEIAKAGGAQRRDRRAGIDELMAPGEARQRQVEQAVSS